LEVKKGRHKKDERKEKSLENQKRTGGEEKGKYWHQFIGGTELRENLGMSGEEEERRREGIRHTVKQNCWN